MHSWHFSEERNKVDHFTIHAPRSASKGCRVSCAIINASLSLFFFKAALQLV